MRTDRFDIVGKADHPIAPADFKAAVMALLAERFRLEVHEETREIPSFSLRAPRTPDMVRPAASNEKYSMGMKDGDVVFTAASMNRLANYLSQILKGPVEDQSKMEAKYDFTLRTSRVERHPGETWGDWVREALEEIGFRVEGVKISDGSHRRRPLRAPERELKDRKSGE
jgi:uncharacterized protein (TIGR03435 family)